MISSRLDFLAIAGFLVAATSACGLHLGRAPLVVEQVSMGAVEVGAPEPRLQQDLGNAMAQELSGRSALGQGPAVSMRVVSAVVSPVAAGGAVWEARLVVRFHLATVPPAEIQLSGVRLFSGDSESWRTVSLSRSMAFEELARQLVAQAVPALLASPGGAKKP
jgi:hypothetical protein